LFQFTETSAEAIQSIVTDHDVEAVIFSKSTFSDEIAPRLSVRLSAGYASNVSNLPLKVDGVMKVERSIFTGKANAMTSITTEKVVLSITKNIVEVVEVGGVCEVINIDTQSSSKIEILSTHLGDTGIPLPDAEKVVSAGRGLGGPENWGMIEELANQLKAATACSKPVSDMDWRPHHEHVGQTGVKISPQLYIAVAISGAIQHLAGVNTSRVIVVINKDPEAPFFKSADYGIVGDAFEVVPQLIAKLKEFKQA